MFYKMDTRHQKNYDNFEQQKLTISLLNTSVFDQKHKERNCKDRKSNTRVSRVFNDLWAAMSTSINSRVKCRHNSPYFN